jgi:Na+-transporting methylmalonyl-CoA/oxaloacetate decarboxylase gamma subunit
VDIANGWTLTILGLFVAFLAMGIFIGVIVLLKRLFPYKEEVVEADEAEAVVVSTPVSGLMEAEVAAIAVAIVAARQPDRSPIGSALLEGRGAWWGANHLASRQGAGTNQHN